MTFIYYSGNDKYFWQKPHKIHTQLIIYSNFIVSRLLTFPKATFIDNAERFVVDLLTDLPIINQVLWWAKI